MGEYTDVGGLKTWYDTSGQGDPLVLLHGGLCTNDTWGAQMPFFAERFRVFAPERRAHGHTPDVDGPLTYADMAADTIGFLETVVKQPAHLVGWSDGGIVGLLVTIARPELVRKLVAISANFKPAAAAGVPESHEMENVDADDPSMDMFRSLYAASSPDGPDHWPVVLKKFFEMVGSAQPDIKPEELAGITTPTLVVSGDDDMVTLEHTVELYRAIPGSELAVVPGTSHALVFEKPDVVNRIVLDFLEKDPVPTMMPFRRRT
ncbi:MAG TPA: alpha/beta hydrolase [Actinomycetota bacterium]|jgi:pimeloyl-ACP methyl ester carboxylesterase|nr:alpha/beta hydrolase [Actinomycetota bacterium]